MLTNEVITIKLDDMKKILSNKIRNEDNYVYICTDCEEAYLYSKHDKRNCKTCSDGLNMKTIDYWITDTSLNHISFAYIKEIKYSLNYFELNLCSFDYQIAFSMDDNRNRKLDYTKAKHAIKILFQEEKLKTKNLMKMKYKLFVDDKEIKFTKSNLREYINDLINYEELIRLGLGEVAHNADDTIWNIYKSYKDLREYLKYELASITLNGYGHTLIQNVKKSDFYYSKVKELVQNNIKCNVARAETNSRWFQNLYVSHIESKLPSIKERYYEIYENISNNDGYYRTFNYHGTISALSLFFEENNYTDEEIDSFLLLAYKQCFDVENSRIFKTSADACKMLEIPLDKLPKELDIYYRKLMKLYEYISYDYTKVPSDFIVNNNLYKLKCDSRKNTIKKAISYNRNFSFVDKILYNHFRNDYSTRLIENTDYIICFKRDDNEEYLIKKIYDKDKEITNIDDIEKIIKIICLKGGK